MTNKEANQIKLVVEGCNIGTAEGGCTSTGNGGGIYTKAKNVVIGKDDAEDRDAVDDMVDEADGETGGEIGGETGGETGDVSNSEEDVITVFTKCVANGSTGGGGIYHDVTDGEMTVSYCSFDTCKAPNKNGGGINTKSKNLTIGEKTNFTNCEAQNGGGIYYNCADGSISMTDTPVTNASGTTYNSSFTSCKATNGHGGGIYTDTAATLSIKGVKFDACSAINGEGGGLNHNKNTATSTTVEDCCFKDCEVTTSGKRAGGLFSNAKKLVVRNTDFSGCEAAGNGGAVVYDNGGQDTEVGKAAQTRGAWFDGCSFSECKSTASNGGAIYASTRYLYVTGASGKTTFDHCTAYSTGGAVYHNSVYNNTDTSDSLARFTDCSFETCKASTGNAGALYSNTYDLAITGTAAVTAEESGSNTGDETAAATPEVRGAFENCYAKGSGGAVYHNQNALTSKLTMNLVDFEGCQAEGSGGGLYANTPDYKVTDCTFTGNKAVNGGGIYIADVSNDTTTAGATFTDCAFSGNTAGSNGGAIWKSTKSTVDLTNCTVGAATGSTVGNTATNGGGIFLNGGTLNLKADTMIAGNTATGDGGGIYQNNGADSTLNINSSASIYNCRAINGGGVYHYSGILNLEEGAIIGVPEDSTAPSA